MPLPDADLPATRTARATGPAGHLHLGAKRSTKQCADGHAVSLAADVQQGVLKGGDGLVSDAADNMARVRFELRRGACP